MDIKGINGIVITAERYEELINAEKIHQDKVQKLEDKLQSLMDSKYEFVHLEHWMGYALKESPTGVLVEELEMMRKQYVVMLADINDLKAKVRERNKALAKKSWWFRTFGI